MSAPSPSIAVARADLESLATGRVVSLFASDMDAKRDVLTERLRDARIAVVGAAGSIGRAVVDVLVSFAPRSIVLLDLDENGLVEIVRGLRADPAVQAPADLVALPIALGSPECARFFRETAPFDYVVNLAAMKHVRSEKDVYSLMRMIDTNVLALNRLLREMPSPARNVFSVSSDKAVRPANLMGASKRIMEDVLLRHADRQPFSAARFANVAFSNGSLPDGFLARVRKRQPIAAPRDVERYFLSHEEAAQLCVLSAVLGENGDVYLPRPEKLARRTLADLATAVLECLGYEPHLCASEEEAKARASALLSEGRWPCLFTDSDTTGEKPLEEFFISEDRVDFSAYAEIGIDHSDREGVDVAALERFLDFAEAAKTSSVSKEDYVREIRALVPSLEHDERHRSLDEKM